VRYYTVAVMLVAWQLLGAAGTDQVALNVRQFPSVITQFWVTQAVKGAARRLRNRDCARVLSDFSDADGHSLADRLAALGISPEEYVLTGVWFYDGTGHPFCNAPYEREAVTQPGRRVNFICSDLFISETPEREITIIHEMLHSLGLGENPPSSSEITKQVTARCGR